MELKKRLRFTSKWFEGIVEIDHINEEDNDLEVYITPPGGQRRFEHWNLQHTIWGFEQGDYTLCCENCTDAKGQNIGNMYRCDKCGRFVS